MSRAFLGLGSNIGDTRKNIKDALSLLEKNLNIDITKKSSYYMTEPIGYKEQEWFLNIVIEINTDLSPYELLDYCNHVENQLKRKRLIRWGPRTIDIDILLYESYSSKEEKLIIPHPRMTERAFVMIPLKEIAPDIKIKGKHIDKIIREIRNQEIKKIDSL